MFTSDDIEDIKALEGHYTQAEIGKMYNVDRRTIGKIFNGVSYKNPQKKMEVQEIQPLAPKFKMSFWSNT